MRFSPTKLLHGLLYSTPVILLTLAACGGGGGGTPTPAPLTAYYTVGGSISGLSTTSGGLVLRNNGGDDLQIASGVVTSYTFATSVANGGSYNVTVLTHPNSPTQVCTIANASGSIASANITNANVTCTDAYTITVKIKGDPSAASGIGPILQNNGSDDLFIPVLPASGAQATYTFSTPVAGGFNVTQLSRARSPGQDCSGVTSGSSITPASGIAAPNTTVNIQCMLASIVPRFAYVTNSTGNTVSAYKIDAASGVLTATGTAAPAGTEPYSVSVDPSGRFAYVANHGSSNISAYSISDSTGALTAIDANGAVTGIQATIAAGTYPISVTVHPSGKFAYVANESSNSISAYSVNTTSGALSAIDANGAVIGTQASIATGTNPYAVAIDPAGTYAYVANYASSDISVYTINQTSGALTAQVTTVPAGTGPSSIAIDPYGRYLLVTNTVSGNVFSYTIANGVLTQRDFTPSGSHAPRSVAIDPNTGIYAYVANADTTGNGVSAYTIDPSTGMMTEMATSPFAAGTTPFSVNVDPSGLFVYVANYSTGYGVSTYKIGSGGTLTPVNLATTGSGPTSVTTTQ